MPERVPRLGLVCITASEEIRFRTVTRTRLLTQSPAARRRILSEIWSHNIEKLGAALEFCRRRAIRFYRMSSSLLPFWDHALGAGLREAFRQPLRKTGELADRFGIRVVVHPDQFVVLSSDSDAVVKNSIAMLEGQARILDDLGLPRSPWAAIEIHGGKAERGEALARTVRALPLNVRSRLVLENDEYSYRAAEILEVCRQAGVPMVFDVHHHLVREGLRTYEHPSVEVFLRKARATWPRPSEQIVHLSNGRAYFRDPCHSDLIRRLPSSYRKMPWIEVEAKGKEQAIERLLRREWPMQARGRAAR